MEWKGPDFCSYILCILQKLVGVSCIYELHQNEGLAIVSRYLHMQYEANTYCRSFTNSFTSVKNLAAECYIGYLIIFRMKCFSRGLGPKDILK